MPTKKETFVVARFKDNDGKYKYACKGYNNTIGSTTDILNAYRANSPFGIMEWMGGHYDEYDPVRVIIETKWTVGKVLKYPKPNEFFDY